MPDTIRTYDLWLRKPTLYPTELRAHIHCGSIYASEYLALQNAQRTYTSTVQRLNERRARTKTKRDKRYYSTFSREMVYLFHGRKAEEIRTQTKIPKSQG